MEADRAEMAARLKEVYNYNSYDQSPNEPLRDHISAPYSHEQHRAFLNRFAYYLRDVLAGRDAQQVADENAYGVQSADSIDAAVEQIEDLSRACEDQDGAAQTASERLADNLLEGYAAYNEALLADLQGNRAAEEAGADSAAEELRRQIIYAMHVIRYAGGRDSGSFGFGNAGSSFYGKGNSLTGIPLLDDGRQPNAHGYAQVADVGAPILKLNDDPENRSRQEESLAEAKAGFDEMVAACRERFGERTAADQALSLEFMNGALASLQYNTDSAEEALMATIADAEAALAEADAARKDSLATDAAARVAAMTAAVDAQKDLVNAWFADQIEWAEKLYDSHYKENILETLAARQEATLAALDDRIAASQAAADAANDALWYALGALEEDFAAGNAAKLAATQDFNDALNADTNDTAEEMRSVFNDNADAENAAKNAAMDQLTKDWAYFLKYLFGYSGYDSSYYNGYDDTVDYSVNAGDFATLGYQGSNGQSSGIEHLNGIGGYGYGGIGGTDYLYSGDHTGLAYGSITGPSPDYFSDSILDPAEDLTTLLEGYTTSYGVRYW